MDPRRPGRVPGHRWRWSLSHTRGQVAVVISPGVACGIDTEAGDVSGWEAWGREVLSGAEGRWLSSLPAGVRDAGFRHLWTVKEALAKATDRGLGAWLRGVTVSLGAPITVSDEEGRLPFTVSLAAGAVPTAVAVAGESRGVEWVFAADPPAAGR
nr:4'-phosphopantetheinyl transferase superfamily protein [Helcobacillus massiliensis]